MVAHIGFEGRECEAGVHLSLSRLNHRLPRGQAYPEVVQGTAEFHHQIADARLPQTDPVLHDAAALDTTVDVLDAQPTLVECLGDFRERFYCVRVCLRQ